MSEKKSSSAQDRGQPTRPNQDSRITEQQAAAEGAGSGAMQHGSQSRSDRDELDVGGRQAGGDVRDQPDEQELRPAENHEAARQGNPTSSSYSSANRRGVEARRREAASSPGSEYFREAHDGKLSSTPQRGAAGSGKSGGAQH